MQKWNKTGPSTDPWGTPLVTGLVGIKQVGFKSHMNGDPSEPQVNRQSASPGSSEE